MDETPGERNNQPDSKSEQGQQVGVGADSSSTHPVPTMEPSAERLSSGNESTQVTSQLGTSAAGKEGTESSLVQEAAEKITASLPIQRSAEGLSSLVSYSSSSAEASGSEDNAQDDQEESNLPSMPDAQKEEQKEEQKVENKPEVVKEPEVEKVLEKENEPMEVSTPEIQETAPTPSVVPGSQPAVNTAVREEETLETLDMSQDPETLLEKVFGLVEKEEMSSQELPLPKQSPEPPIAKESQELPIPKEPQELLIPEEESQDLPIPKESQELPIPKKSQELPIPKEESQELSIPKEAQELSLPKESKALPLPKESQELPLPKEPQELPLPKESEEPPLKKEQKDPKDPQELSLPKDPQELPLPKEPQELSLPKEPREVPLPKEPQEVSLPKEPQEVPLPKEPQEVPLPKEPQEVPLPKEPQELPLPQESEELPLSPKTEEQTVEEEDMEVEESTTPATDFVQEEPKAVATDPEVRQTTPDTPQEEGPDEVPDDSTFENEMKSEPMEDQEELPSVESVNKADPLPESVKSPAEEDGETCTLKLSSDESTGPAEVDYKANAEEEKKQLLESVDSSRSEPDTQETAKDAEGTAFDVENTLGMKLKRVLDEEKENSSEEPVMKRACMEEMPVSSTSFEGKLLERQNTIPFEPELEEGLSEQMVTSEEMKAESIQKSDEESRDDGLSLSSDLKETSKLDDLKSKVKEDEEEIATPASRRRRKKKSYERPRGEGGKFRKEKPDASLMDEDTRMDSSLLQDEDSQGSISKREVRRFRCEVIVPESTEAFTADKVVEYVWPLEGIGEHYFIQEQISQYLGIMSFKRKYPDLRRRPIDMQERDYLKEKGLVSEMACDLGLTAVRSEDVLDVMFNDFPSKFEELQRLLRERKEIEMKERGKISYSMANIDKSKMQEYGRKAAEDAARWNAAFNKEKRDERRYSFDLQTFTLQMPVGRGKKLPPEITKMGYYTVAVLPGQFTDYYREYSSAALSSMPLNSVVAPPVTRDTLGSDGADSDSEEEASVPAPDETDGVETKDEKGEDLPQCKVCGGNKNRNKSGKPEPLIMCGSCRSASHPTCIDLTLAMVPKIESYNWQCMDCKNCVLCSDPDDEEKMIFCDMCDRGYHIYCVGLRRVPNGRWHCKECAICSSCGSKTPAGNEHVKNAEWQHEFKKDKDNKQLKYATTLCVPCDKYWKRRQFCYVCLKVYRSIPEDGMVRCSNCPKYIHKEGCSTMYENERFCNNCFKMRNTTALNHSRIIAAAKKKMASGY